MTELYEVYCTLASHHNVELIGLNWQSKLIHADHFSQSLNTSLITISTRWLQGCHNYVKMLWQPYNKQPDQRCKWWCIKCNQLYHTCSAHITYKNMTCPKILLTTKIACIIIASNSHFMKISCGYWYTCTMYYKYPNPNLL